MKSYVTVSVGPYAFANDTELSCIVIGFGKNENGHFPGQGFVGNASVKYGPDACKWPVKYRLNR